MEVIDRASETPIYQQIAAILRGRIERGVYLPGTPIASEPRLCEEFGVAPLTARAAVRVLIRAGLVRVVPGKGTYVIGQEATG